MAAHETPIRRREFSRAGPAIASLALALVLIALIELAVDSGWVSAFVVPSPLSVIASIPDLFTAEHLVRLFALTFGITFLATALCAVIGIPCGWLLYRYRTFGQAYESWLAAIFSAPIILLYPLFLVLIGRSVVTILVMSFISSIPPVILSSYEGFKNAPKVYSNVARSFNMPERDILLKVLLPAALPPIFTGIRLALIYTMINVVAMEFLISIGGLGFLVGDLYDRYELPGMYAAVVFVVLASALFFIAINGLESWLKRR